MSDRLFALILGGLCGALVGFVSGAGGLWLLLGMVTPC